MQWVWSAYSAGGGTVKTLNWAAQNAGSGPPITKNVPLQLNKVSQFSGMRNGLRGNTGSFYAGTSDDTPEFAVGCTANWWKDVGKIQYPRVNEPCIPADGVDSNGHRPRDWNYFLQETLATPFNLTVTVAHYPSGASNWNPIEHPVR